MGQRFAPSIANIYLRLWEESLFLKAKQKPVAFFRYGVWSGSPAKLNSFLQLANSIKINSHLQYHIHFKDTTLAIGHSILHRCSHHPKHTFKSIVYSQIRRCAELYSIRQRLQFVPTETSTNLAKQRIH